MQKIAHCNEIQAVPPLIALIEPKSNPTITAFRLRPSSECPAREPHAVQTVMPIAAHNIGRTRERPSLWNDPNPTDIAPLAATSPAAGCPNVTPATRQVAMATVHGRE